MPYSDLSAEFLSDKNEVLTAINTQNSTEQMLGFLETRPQATDYGYILRNLSAIQANFRDQFESLKAKKDNQNNQVFWATCYYWAYQLEFFEQIYKDVKNQDEPENSADNQNKEKQKAPESKFAKIRREIRARLQPNSVVENNQPKDDFDEYLKKSLQDGFTDFINIPFHISKIRSSIGFINVCRLYWAFCRLTLTQGFYIARDLDLIKALDNLLGTHTDIDKIINVFNAPIQVLNYFSVGLFLARLIIDVGLLVQHTFYPNDEEAKASEEDRRSYEWNKRKTRIANDVGWGVMNYFCNFKIIGPLSGYLTAAFLLFDIANNFYRLNEEREGYLIRLAQYEQEIINYDNRSDMEPVEREKYKDMLHSQIDELNVYWHKMESSHYFQIAAASLFAVGFTTAILVSPPMLIMASFFVCTLAAAMYLSGGSYEAYKEKDERLTHAKRCGVRLNFAEKEYEAAQQEFIFTMTKNTFMPMILITAYSISWPIALLLTALYMGIEFYHAQDQHALHEEADSLALAL